MHEVYDGQTALAETEAEHPDVVVIDSSLPTLDGFQVLDRLRRHPSFRHLPVIMLSTLPKSLGGELSRSLGAARFLPKPFTAVQITEAIDVALAPRDAPPAVVTPSTIDWRARLRSAAAASAGRTSVVELPVPPRRRVRAPRRPRRNA